MFFRKTKKDERNLYIFQNEDQNLARDVNHNILLVRREQTKQDTQNC
jgi:hypothetical protein